jgi:hypothetical protein
MKGTTAIRTEALVRFARHKSRSLPRAIDAAVPPGVPGAAGEGAPDELPLSLRPACRLAPEGDDASATCSARADVTVEEDEEGPHDAKTGLGSPSSAHLRRRCRGDETHSGPIFNATAGRTRRNTGIPSAISHDS